MNLGQILTLIRLEQSGTARDWLRAALAERLVACPSPPNMNMLQQIQALTAATPPIVEFKAGMLERKGERTRCSGGALPFHFFGRTCVFVCREQPSEFESVADA